MNRQAQAVVLLLVGGTVLRVSLTDQYLRYVKQGLRPFLIAAGIALVAAAVMTLWYELRPRQDPHHAHEGSGADAHGHSGEPRVAWLLLLPVVGLLLVAPPALGSYAANRAGTALQEVSDFPALPAGDPVRITVLDYATRAVFDEGRSLGDRRVEITGFALPAPDGQWYLARMMLNCCAGDARPVKVALDGNLPGDLHADTWLTVTGTYPSRSTTDSVNGERIPYLTVESATVIPAPADQYQS